MRRRRHGRRGVVLHDAHHLAGGRDIIVGNHVSWFDVLALAATAGVAAVAWPAALTSRVPAR